MRKMISALWSGDLRPYEQLGKGNKEIGRLLSRMEEARKNLEENLGEKGSEMLEEYEQCMDEYMSVVLEEAFSDGFCLGGRITAEMFSETSTK